jgi:putative ABC transport system permease protein
MLIQTFRLAVRSLLRLRGYAFINVLGLGLGLAAAALIMLYTSDELSYDRFHAKRDRIYRVNTVFSEGEGLGGYNETNAWPIGDVLRREFPEVESVLYTRSGSFLLIEHEGKKMRQRIYFASPEFFSIFSFPLLRGTEAEALSRPYTIVISESMERKYFAPGEGIGKSLKMNDTLQFEVTGIMKDIPPHSHIQLDMVVSFLTYEDMERGFSYTDGWGNINMHNYVLMREGIDMWEFSKKAGNLYNDKAAEMLKSWGMRATVAFEPLGDVYLKSRAGNSMGPQGSYDTVRILLGAGVFVLLLACINFINLATARSIQRSREVGVKKVVGSSRGALVRQFLSESLAFTIIASLLALVLVGLFLPVFNDLLRKNYSLSEMAEPAMTLGFTGLVCCVALLAGYYPAWVLSGARPAEVLKGRGMSSSGGIRLRKVLVVLQFGVSACLIIGTLIIRTQLNFMLTKDLGFARDQVVVVSAAQVRSADRGVLNAFANDLRSQSITHSVSFCNALPALSGWRGQIAYPEGKEGEDAVDMEYMAIDENYLRTLDLKLIAGQNFDPDRPSELQDGLLINETAVTALGWGSAENALGRKITSPSGYPEGTVMGVVKDYHDMSLQSNIPPMAMDYSPGNSYLYAIRYNGSETAMLLTTLEGIWKKYFPQNDFIYMFLDERFEAQYAGERRMVKVFTVFASIAILIAVIGLFGLLSFFIAAKTKEVGIRKVMGASVPAIIQLLSREFLLLVVIANGIALPLAYFASERWLQGFAYRTRVPGTLLLAAFGISLAITVVTISLQTIKAARSNPVNALRYE